MICLILLNSLVDDYQLKIINEKIVISNNFFFI